MNSKRRTTINSERGMVNQRSRVHSDRRHAFSGALFGRRRRWRLAFEFGFFFFQALAGLHSFFLQLGRRYRNAIVAGGYQNATGVAAIFHGWNEDFEGSCSFLCFTILVLNTSV